MKSFSARAAVLAMALLFCSNATADDDFWVGMTRHLGTDGYGGAVLLFEGPLVGPPVQPSFQLPKTAPASLEKKFVQFGPASQIP